MGGEEPGDDAQDGRITAIGVKEDAYATPKNENRDIHREWISNRSS